MTRKAATMPTTDALPDRQQLEQEAARLNAQLEALRQQDLHEQEAERQRQAEREQEYDEAAAKAFSRANLDVEVQQARAEFDAALAADPLVAALADYGTALQRRRTAAYEHMSLLSRLGRLPNGRFDPPSAELGPIEEVIGGLVGRIVQQRIDADAAEEAARRQAAITGETSA